MMRLPGGRTTSFTSSGKTWDEADSFCKSEGGQLASIHSVLEQKLAEKAAGRNKASLGGRRALGAEWSWSDNSSWGFTNWRSGSGDDDDSCLYMYKNGYWYDYACYTRRYVLCQGDIAVIQDGALTTFEMQWSQLKLSLIHI